MCIFVCMFNCCPPNCVHGKGHHQLGRGERSFKDVPFSRPRHKPGLWYTISCHAANFALMLGLETMEKYPRIIPSPCTIDPSGNWTCGPHFTRRGNHQIISQKNPLQADWKLEGSGAHAGNTTSAQHRVPLDRPPNYCPKLGCHTLALQGTLWPHLTSIWRVCVSITNVNVSFLNTIIKHAKLIRVSFRVPKWKQDVHFTLSLVIARTIDEDLT